MSTVKCRLQTIFLSLLILTSLFSFVTPFQISFESQYTKTISAGSPVVTFRDILDTSATVDPIISLDQSNYPIGATATLTVTDTNADVNIGAVDFTSATVTMSSATTVTLQETDANTGVFTGTFTIDAAPSVDYTQDSPEAARAQITLPVNPGGSVQLNDATFTENELVNLGIKPVTGAVEITLSGGASFTSSSPTVKISYANANLDGEDINNLEMWYKAPSQSWEKVTSNNAACGFCGTFLNTVTQTMQSDPSGPGFVGTDGQGQYVLAFDTGTPGGGGGGLVRPGLVVNALAGLSTLGGGSSGPPGPTITLGAVALSNSGSETISMPQEIRDLVLNHDPQIPLEPIVDIFEDFDLPLSINGNGFALGGYENTLVTQTIEPGVPNEYNIVFYTNSEIAHTSLYFNLGPTKTVAGSDTQVLLYKDRPIEIIDPNGNIASATGTINNDGELKRVVTFSITFSEDMQWSDSDLVIRAWNDNLNSGDTIVYDAIQIAPSEEQVAFEESIPEPEVEQLKSQHVPIWIKNNANWWSQELIEDADFVAGLEYLIQNNIVTIPDSEITVNEITTQKIPSWIKNTAGWWSENQITEKEFIDGIQWLISNGIIKVVET